MYIRDIRFIVRQNHGWIPAHLESTGILKWLETRTNRTTTTSSRIIRATHFGINTVEVGTPIHRNNFTRMGVNHHNSRIIYVMFGVKWTIVINERLEFWLGQMACNCSLDILLQPGIQCSTDIKATRLKSTFPYRRLDLTQNPIHKMRGMLDVMRWRKRHLGAQVFRLLSKIWRDRPQTIDSHIIVHHLC